VVPAVYSLVARKSHSPEYISQMVEKLKKAAEGETPPAAQAGKANL